MTVAKRIERVSLADALRRAADWLDQNPGLAERVAYIEHMPALTLHFNNLWAVSYALKGRQVVERGGRLFLHYAVEMDGFVVTALGEPVKSEPERKFTL